jgi:bifunctional aspartokinase / homoserine dehydrogenase 1
MADPNPRRVLKFGGTSVGSIEALRHALAIVKEAAPERPLAVVVSALSGVTDQLAALAQGVGRGLDAGRILASLRARHLALLAAVADGPVRRDAEAAWRAVWTGLDRDLATIARGGDRALCDSVLAAGERLAAPLFVAGLKVLGLRARAVDGADLIRTDAGWGEASVDFSATRALVARRFEERPADGLPVVTGFVGSTADGRTTVLGRGGSDYTAAIIGAALEADRVDIWTDVDGILSADPHLVDDAFTLKHLSYAEALTLAEAGAKVLHPKTIPPLAEGRIPVFVGNTSRREGPGSWVGTEGVPGLALAKAVASTAVNGHATISVLPSRLDVGRQLAGRVLEVLAAAGLPATAGSEPADGSAVTVVVATELRAHAVRAIHATLVRRRAEHLVEPIAR